MTFTIKKSASPSPGAPLQSGKSAAKAKGKPKLASSFRVRPSTVAACQAVVGDAVVARLFHAFLELWVDTARKVERLHEGKKLDFLFLSSGDLQTLSGLSEGQIYKKAIPGLKATPFFIVATKRLTPDSPNVYAIHLDQEAFWFEIVCMTKPFKKAEGGMIAVQEEIDRSTLPYLWKRLYDNVTKKSA